MTSKTLMLAGLVVVLGGCAKKSQETDALSPPPAARDTVHAGTQHADSMRMQGDSTVRMKTDSVVK